MTEAVSLEDAGKFSPEAIMVFVKRPAGSPGGEFRLYATRTLSRAQFRAEVENYEAGWNLAARMINVLIRDGGSYGECLSWVFQRWENEDRDKPALSAPSGLREPETRIEIIADDRMPPGQMQILSAPAGTPLTEIRGTSVNPTLPCGKSVPPEGRELWFCQECREFHEVQTQLRQLDPARLPGVTTVWSQGKPKYRTRTGVVLTDHELQRLADEAERGYCAEPDPDRPARFICRKEPGHHPGTPHSWQDRP
jgi:hypothetical protein